MTSQSPSSPSEGEIVESDADLSHKALISQTSTKDENVDRRSRRRHPGSRSKSPYWRGKSHSRSRSPYRAQRGEKRAREDRNRPANVRHENHFYGGRRGFYHDSSNRFRGHDSQYGTSRDKRRRMKSRSPFRHPSPGGVPHTERIGTNEKCEPARDDSNTKNELKDEPAPPEVDPPLEVPIDENKLIEERRKKRELIKARHKQQATPLPVEAPAIGRESASGSPKPLLLDTSTSALEKAQEPSTSALKDITNQASLASLVVPNDQDLANNSNAAYSFIQEDGPRAIDYDPTMDMQEDRAREGLRQQEELPSSAYDETTTKDQNVLLPQSTNEALVQQKPKDPYDMFANDDLDDMFAEHPTGPQALDEAKAVAIPQAKAFDTSMLDDRDDAEGYYKVFPRELIDGRYDVQEKLGKGIFASVIRANDQKNNDKAVAIKIIRNNDSMKKAGLKEIDILRKLAENDPEDKKHVVRLQRTFEHASHLCMVFENLHVNLREVLKKHGRNGGINLRSVRTYARQMFVGLSYLRKCNILHADLKPDNILVDERFHNLKICDLGSASDVSDNEITPYLVSRFYRAPEIILGLPYDFAIDMWSIGCTLFELYTGNILFTGRSNNQMLRSIMECRGKFPPKLLRKSKFGSQHFDDLLNFRSIEKDNVTGREKQRIINFVKPVHELKPRIMASADTDELKQKELLSFIELLEKCLGLNPDKRCTPMDALKHPFIKG
ncbi:MAG: hypothetical protein LQ351_003156 [Letrouitia transgressa]|nr:MAG: hypothetical protein LQ351_003156 [Letrouitia transgressa]